MWFDEKCEIQINRGIYSPQPESFGRCGQAYVSGIVHHIQMWHSCREDFHVYTKKKQRFYYHHDLPKERGRGKSIAVFFDKVEAELKIPEKERSKFGATNYQKVMWFEMSGWWRKSSIRRSLFTALLRQSRGYYICKNNYKKTLYDGEYTDCNRKALKRFMSGNTYYWGRETGWVMAFEAYMEDPYDYYGNAIKRKLDLTKLLRDNPRPSNKKCKN